MTRPKLKQLPKAKIETQYVQFIGGIDLETPVLSINPGACLTAVNYEPLAEGGYKRIDALERYDGRTSPSAAVYYVAEATFSGTPVVGDTITGVTSLNTAVIAAVGDGFLILTKMPAALVIETFTGSGGGSITATPAQGAGSTGLLDATYLNAAADIYRADILQVGGASRPIRGGWTYKGVQYAFQNNAAGTACLMYKSTAAGWVEVTFGEEVSFTAGNDGMQDGDTLTQGGVTATIARVVQTTSATSPNRVGRFIITGRSGGNFSAGAATDGGAGSATLSGVQTQITMLPSGRFEFVNHNFSASEDTLKMYGCDGVNRAFEFDGTTFVPISTGMDKDAPVFITAHKQQLFLAFRGSSQNSGIGFPYIWTAVTGAAELGIGDSVTGYARQVGDTLAIGARNSLHQLVGSSVDDYSLKSIAPDVGMIPYTAQNIGQTFCLDDRGIIMVAAVTEYGNFSAATVSKKVQQIIDRIRSKVVASAVYRTRNQYRLYCNDGTGVILTILKNKVVGITEFDYNHGRSTNLINPTCAWSGEDATGKDVVFIGADNGYVYQCDKGSSFDGEDIESYLRMPFNNLKSPRHKKQYHLATMEMSAVGYSALRFQPEFSYGNPDTPAHDVLLESVQGPGGTWDVSNWDEFFWDAALVATPRFKIEGGGTNIALLFYSKSQIDRGHTLQGVLLQYEIRRLVR